MLLDLTIFIKNLKMENSIFNAFILLSVGMSAVFFILFIVVSGGKLLIRLVNKINLEIEEVPFTSLKSESVTSTKETAIIEAVKILTSGKGKVDYIRKK